MAECRETLNRKRQKKRR